VYRFAILGNMTEDFFCSTAYRLAESAVAFDELDPPTSLTVCEPILPGRKVSLAAPLSAREAAGLAGPSRPGGGGLGTASSIAYWLASRSIYIDVSSAGGAERLFDRIGVAHRFLGLRPPPRNLVLGMRGNKVVLTSPVSPVLLDREQRAAVASLLERPEWVVINSIKDEPLAELVVQSVRARASCRLAAVLTRSLPPRFVRERILPHCDIVVASFDELSWVLSSQRTDLSASRERLEMLRSLVRPRTAVFVTLGREGVLCGDANGFFHVRLASAVACGVDAAIRVRPAHLTGAGDWFVGGVLAGRCSYRWGPMPFHPQVVQDAVAGCIAAIHHLGSHVEPADFDVHENVLSEYSFHTIARRDSRGLETA
jgi:sugar/nucleoside kinase (ribokinase family)